MRYAGNDTVPAKVHGTKVRVSMDIVCSDIPLLLSKDAMKRAGISLNFKDDEIIALDRKAKLISTSSGHPILSLQAAPGEWEKTEDVMHRRC